TCEACAIFVAGARDLAVDAKASASDRSHRFRFMVPNLLYQNPAEMLTWLLIEVSPRVKIDHGYSSLASGRGKYYDFTVYLYKD
ncbi:MAG: hypothetical protein B7Y80_20500, partial [Hyphomicrobium sp. 32-62-53]